ncbi:glycerophosphodiester phosphodiesterase family protein [Roseibium salinum]|nr:glycerophosphodiester phosphodiesterase family protein [Roseibium salinum]
MIENTPTAIRRAIEKNFAIEVDVQETADGEALVFHDYTLDRLAEGAGERYRAILRGPRSGPHENRHGQIVAAAGSVRSGGRQGAARHRDQVAPAPGCASRLRPPCHRPGHRLSRTGLHQDLRSGHAVHCQGPQQLGLARHRCRCCCPRAGLRAARPHGPVHPAPHPACAAHPAAFHFLQHQGPADGRADPDALPFQASVDVLDGPDAGTARKRRPAMRTRSYSRASTRTKGRPRIRPRRGQRLLRCKTAALHF